MNPFFAYCGRLAGWVGVSLVLLAGLFTLARAEESPAAPSSQPPPAAQEMYVVVSQMINANGGSLDSFNRFAQFFPETTESRKWPIKVTVERLAAGGTEHELELRVYLMDTRQDVPDQFTVRAWVTLVVNGKKTDFGILRATRTHRYMQPIDRVVEALYKDIANATADRIEPLLFQRMHVSQQKDSSPSKMRTGTEKQLGSRPSSVN